VNKKCFLSPGLAALTVVCATVGNPAAPYVLRPLVPRADQDTVRVLRRVPLPFDKRIEAHLIGASPPEDHGYFHEGPEFRYYIKGLGASRVSQPVQMVRAAFLQRIPRKTDNWVSDDYRFDWLATGEPFTLVVSSGLSQPLNVIPGTVYDLVLETQSGWPSAYGLIIKQNGALVFQGLTDWKADGVVSTDGLSPIRASQTRVLTDHYMKSGNPCYGKITNVEITFSFASERLALHQGQSSRVILHQGQSRRPGQYELTLLVARAIEYSDRCLDTGMNGISFTVSRKGREQGANHSPQLGDCFTIYLKPGTIDFPSASDGSPVHLIVPPDSIRFLGVCALGEILGELGWSGCEKVVPTIREGQTMSLPPSHRERGDAALWLRHYDEPVSRAYVFYLRPDSSRSPEWRLPVKRRLLETTCVDSVEFGPPP